jgi:hypothetical protein
LYSVPLSMCTFGYCLNEEKEDPRERSHTMHVQDEGD